jgi:hypothetical protein
LRLTPYFLGNLTLRPNSFQLREKPPCRNGKHGYCRKGLRMDLPIDLKNHIRPDQRVPVVDDLIATGGTAEAAINLISQRGDTVVGSTYIIESSCSNGRDRVPVPVTAMASYDFQSQAAPEPAALATIA